MKLLYLEDNKLDADLTVRALSRSMPDALLLIAHTLAEARERLSAHDDFDLALLDVNLPDGSGMDLLAEIRARQLPIAVVLLTGAGDEQTVVRALKFQADDYLVKRDDYLEQLPATLRQALQRFKQESWLRSRPLTVLYVEHNVDDANLTRLHLLRAAPHIRLDIVNGADGALRMLEKGGQQRYQLLLLDYRLAGMDALELIKELKVHRHVDLPIVMITGRGSEDVAAAALRLGISDYLIKDAGYLAKLPSVLETSYAYAELRNERARLHYLATYDELTGLLSRSEFHSRAMQVLSRAQRQGERCAVLMVDLDDFKAVNDTFGHGVGDDLLRGLATRLKLLLRDEDICCRFGGDEFIVLLPGAGESGAAHTAGRISEALNKRAQVGEHEIASQASIGISIFPEDGADIDTLVQNSDTAMYKAKTGGRGHFRFFDVAMNEEVAERFQVEADLRRALERKELFLAYQPQVETRTGKVVAVEALLRWRHPKRGLVGPDRFIPVAESCGLILPLGEWVLRTSCRQLRQWDEQGLPPLKMAINLSARQFRGEELEQQVMAAIVENGLMPGRLELELTETAVAEDPAGAKDMLQRMKALGVSIAIDDFGTGYSSLSCLRGFPLDCLKIDRSFVAEISNGEDGAVMSAAIIGLAARLGLSVIAEGVERLDQLQYLQEQECPYAQGFLIAEPMEAASFVAWLKTSGRHGHGEAVVLH